MLVIEKNKEQVEGWTPTWHGDDVLAIFGVTMAFRLNVSILKGNHLHVENETSLGYVVIM